MEDEAVHVRKAMVASPSQSSVSLADWAEAVRLRFCTFEYADLGGGLWTVEQSQDGSGGIGYRIYNHRTRAKPLVTTDLGKVAELMTSCSAGCLPAHLRGTIGVHPWREVTPSSIDSVVRAAREGRICGQYGETLPVVLSRVVVQLLLSCISRAEESDLVRHLDMGETVIPGWRELEVEPPKWG